LFFQELVHLDNVFLQAAATIFNKDIVLVSPDTESPLVLLGGPNNTRGKGAPFLLGYLPAVDDVPCQYFSVVPARPGSSPDWLSGNAAEAGTGLPCADSSATAADEVSNLGQNDEESVEKLLDDQNNDSSPVEGVEQQSGHIWEATNGIDTATTDLSGVNSGYPLAGGEVVMRATSGRSWKRMDSYSGSLSRDLDQMIQEIQSGSDLQELYAKLDHCDDDQEENDKYEEEKDEEEEEKEGNNDDENEEDEEEVVVNCDAEEEKEEEEMNNDAEKEEDDRQVEDEVNDDGEEEWEEVANYCDGKEEEEVLDQNDGQEAWDSADNINDHNRVDETVVEGDEGHNQEIEETKEETCKYEAEKEAAEYEEEQGEDEEDLWEEQNEKQEEQNHVMEEAMDAEEGSDTTQIDQNTPPVERRSSQIRRRIRITATLSQDEEEVRTSWDPAGSSSDSGSTARLGWSHAAATGSEPTGVETAGGGSDRHYNNDVYNNSSISTATALVSSNSRQCIQEPSTSGPGEDDTAQGEDQYIPLAYLSADTSIPLSPVVDITATDDGLRPVALVSTPDGQQTEVPLRAAAAASGQQQRYRRKGSRASYRWSGQEMYQVDGPPTFTSNGLNAPEEPEVDGRPTSGGAGDPDAVRKVSDALAAEAAAQAAEDRLASRLAKYGLAVSRPAATDCDSCFKALIDQMTQPGQDFPAWDRDDHTFLRWYVCKQLEILAASGRGADYILAASGRDGADDILAGEEQQSDINATLASFQVPTNK